jgi:membrane protease YdiL (CAAX protease family)
MKALLLTLCALLLSSFGVLHPLEAALPEPTYRIELVDANSDKLQIVDATFPSQVSEREKTQRYVREVLFPKVEANAAAGLKPAAWEIGFFHLNGWGVGQDLTKAEAAFRIGLENKRGHGAWRLGYVYFCKAIEPKMSPAERVELAAKSKDLYCGALGAGFKTAEPEVILQARAHLHAWWGLERDLAGAEALIEALGAVVPESARYQFVLSELRYKQKRFAEAFEHASSAVAKFKAKPVPADLETEHERAKKIRIAAAFKSQRLSELKQEELIGHVRAQVGDLGPWMWAVPAGVLLMLGALLWWTYGTRQRGPSFWLSVNWIAVAATSAGIGFLFSLPALNQTLGQWIGAIMVAVACLVSVWICGPARYLGNTPVFTGFSAWLRTAGVLLAIVAGVQLLGLGYQALYAHVVGKKLDSQLVGLLLQTDTPSELVVTLLVAGLAIPFYEEVFFRGFLFDALQRRWGAGWALGLSSVSFALIHGVSYAPVILVLSLPLGWLRLRSGNLRHSILLHCLNNTLAVAALHFGKN